MDKTIKQLFMEHRGKVSDKWLLYLNEWDRLFAPYRSQPIRFLEIGIQNGGSLEIWSASFPKAEKIIGCDIDQKCVHLRYDDPRIAVIVGDANSDDCEAKILMQASSFEIVIDDGSHKSSDIVRSFARYFPHLSDEGLYVVEDLHASYWKDYEGGLHDPFSAMAFFKRLADIVNYEHWRNNKPRWSLLKVFAENLGIEFKELELTRIHSIEFINSLCIIKKFPPEKNVLGNRIIVGTDEYVSREWKKLNGSVIQDFEMDIGDDANLDVFELVARNIFLATILADKDQALQDILRSETWKLALWLRKTHLFLFPLDSPQTKVLQYLLSIIRGVKTIKNTNFYFGKYLNYLRKNGLRETVITIMHRLRDGFQKIILNVVFLPKIIFDLSTRASLQRVLKILNIQHESSEVLHILARTLGLVKTSQLLANIVAFDKFLSAPDNRLVYPLVQASQLPPASPGKRKRNILFITAQFPSPQHGGGNRVLNFIKTLSVENNIYLCTAYSANEHEHDLPFLKPYCQKILKIPDGRFGGNQDNIRKWIGEIKMDIVHYEWPRSLENYARDFGVLQIFTYMEAVSLRLLMDMEHIPPLSALWVKKFEQLSYSFWLEFSQASQLDARVAVTTKDADFFRGLYPFQEYVILNHGLSFEEFTLPDFDPEPNTLVFVGNYLHYPNVEALEFFFNEIWEDIRKEIPEIRIYVVGTNPTDTLLSHSDGKHIIITGTVADVRPYIQKASVCIAPLISGAGLRGKVMEYAALHRPFVATSIASTDLVFKNGIDYFCADTAHEFSNKIITLLKDPQLARKMAQTAYETARQNYDNQRLTGFLLSLYEYLENNSHVN